MYVLCKSKNILTLVSIGYIVGFIVGMYVEYCYGPKWPYWIYILHILDCLGQVYAGTVFG